MDMISVELSQQIVAAVSAGAFFGFLGFALGFITARKLHPTPDTECDHDNDDIERHR